MEDMDKIIIEVEELYVRLKSVFHLYLIIDSIFNGASFEIYTNIIWKLFIFRRLNTTIPSFVV